MTEMNKVSRKEKTSTRKKKERENKMRLVYDAKGDIRRQGTKRRQEIKRRNNIIKD
jgi:hypothetical protein